MGEEPSGLIFISYRRVDMPHLAGWLFDRLEAARFGGDERDRHAAPITELGVTLNAQTRRYVVIPSGG